MPMDCPELKAIIASLPGNCIPQPVHDRIEEHMASCRACKAGISNFLQIGKILEKTVYGQRSKDDTLRYLSHIADRKLHWETEEERCRRVKKAGSLRLLLKLAAGFMAAAGLGASLAMILSYLGWIGQSKVAELDLTGQAAQEELAAKLDHSQMDSAAELPAVVPEGGMSPDAVFRYLNADTLSPENLSGQPLLAPGDSAQLNSLEAELGALRDAISRDPTDMSLRRRMMDKYRQVIDERLKLKQRLRVQDYYNLGYLHYEQAEYPQTAIVTAEGLRTVRMGPTQYLHYLKAMSHYQIAQRASEPLPADSSADSTARLLGAQMRAELDQEGRRRAVTELRKAITEFGYLLSTPALSEPARDWILRCNEQIGQLSTGE
jgi:hypothetical protein